MSVLTMGKLIALSIFFMPIYLCETIVFEGWDMAAWILKQAKKKIIKVVRSAKKKFTT